MKRSFILDLKAQGPRLFALSDLLLSMSYTGLIEEKGLFFNNFFSVRPRVYFWGRKNILEYQGSSINIKVWMALN